MSLGWIMGYEDNTFRPDKAITRAEAVTMINRVLQRNPQSPEDLLKDMVTWPDNQDPASGTTWPSRRPPTATTMNAPQASMRPGPSCGRPRLVPI